MELNEKVEALTQTVDLIFSMQKANEEKIELLLVKATANENHMKQVIVDLQRLFEETSNVSGMIGPLAHNSNVLIGVIQDHEFRIGELENPTKA